MQHNTLYCGIDPSMNSTAITYILGDECNSTLFSSKHPQYIATCPNIKVVEIAYANNEDRFEKISSGIINDIKANILKHKAEISDFAICMEGYSYGSSGTVFEIGEFVGTIKNKLHCAGFAFNTVPPTTVKKYVGKGNFDKNDIYIVFRKRAEAGEKLHVNYLNHLIGLYKNSKKYVGLTGISTIKSPLSDLLDSFYIAQYVRDLKNDNISNEIIHGASEDEISIQNNS